MSTGVFGEYTPQPLSKLYWLPRVCTVLSIRSGCAGHGVLSKYSSQYTFQLVPPRMYIAGTALAHIQVVLLTVWAARTRWISTGTALVNVQAVLITVYSSKYSPVLCTSYASRSVHRSYGTRCTHYRIFVQLPAHVLAVQL